jgi:hypothetical protein
MKKRDLNFLEVGLIVTTFLLGALICILSLPLSSAQLFGNDNGGLIILNSGASSGSTTYTNGTGINLSGSSFSLLFSYSLPQGCVGGEAAFYNDSTEGWYCGSVGGGGTVMSISQGEGIILTPNPITTTGTAKTNNSFIGNAVRIPCGNITGASSNLCTIVDTSGDAVADCGDVDACVAGDFLPIDDQRFNETNLSNNAVGNITQNMTNLQASNKTLFDYVNNTNQSMLNKVGNLTDNMTLNFTAVRNNLTNIAVNTSNNITNLAGNITLNTTIFVANNITLNNTLLNILNNITTNTTTFWNNNISLNNSLWNIVNNITSNMTVFIANNITLNNSLYNMMNNATQNMTTFKNNNITLNNTFLNMLNNMTSNTTTFIANNITLNNSFFNMIGNITLNMTIFVNNNITQNNSLWNNINNITSNLTTINNTAWNYFITNITMVNSIQNGTYYNMSMNTSQPAFVYNNFTISNGTARTVFSWNSTGSFNMIFYPN